MSTQLDVARAQLAQAVSSDAKAPANDVARIFLAPDWGLKPSDAATFVEPLTPDQRKNLISAAVAGLLPSLCSTIQQGGGGENAAEGQGVGLSDALAAATKLAHVLFALMHDEAALPPGFMDLASGLHDCLWSFDAENDVVESLRSGVLRLCEKIWVQGRPDRERIITLSFPMLVARCLGPDATGADAKRAWALRDAIGLFDFSCEDSEGLRDMLVRCFTAPALLRTVEARRFLVAIACAGPAFVEAAHAHMRAAMPGAPKRTLDAFGDIYAKTWAAGDAGVRLALESRALQDLVSRAAHAASPELFAAVARVLAPIVSKAHAKGRAAGAAAEALVFRTHGPVLTRALSAANPAVRKNAALLLFEAFPVADPEASPRDAEAGAKAQFDTLHALLRDESPAVREVAIQGVARVLNVFWEAIPAAAARALVDAIIGELSHDMRSPAVRAAVPAGVAFLLSQPLCHGVVAPVLPALAHLIHDRSDKVRAAMTGLLLAVADIRTLDVYAVVGVDQLLARMAFDAHLDAVAAPLARLLLPSFIAPEAFDNNEMMRRILSGLNESAAALCAIMAHAHRTLPAVQLAKTILVLKAALIKAIRRRDARLAAAAAAGPLAAGEDEGGEDAAEADDDAAGQGEEEAGFRRKRSGRDGGGAAGAAKVARSSRTRGEAATSVVAAQAAGVAAAAAAAPPLSQPTALLDAGNIKVMEGLTRILSVLWATLTPVIAQPEESEGGGGAAAMADADDAAPAATAAAGLVPQTRARLFEEFGGDTIARLLRCLSDPLNTWEASAAGTGGSRRLSSVGSSSDWAARGGGSGTEGNQATAGITAALLSVAGYLPQSSVVGLAESVWDRLVQLPPAAVPAELPGLVSCLTAWGRIGDAVTAALGALDAAARRAEAGVAPEAGADEEDEEEDGGTAAFMHPRVAIQLIEVAFTNAAAGVDEKGWTGAGGEAAAVVGMLPHALTLLFAGLRAAPRAADAVSPADAASIAAFAVCAARAWCRVLFHAIPLLLASAEGGGSSDAPSQVSAFVSSSASAAVRWVAEVALPVSVAVAEEEATGGDTADERAPQEACSSALRSIIVTVASACGDLALLGLAVDAGTALVAACTSTDAVALPGSGGGDGGGDGMDLLRHSTGSPLEWVAASAAPADAAPLDAVLRLCLRLHSAACGNASSVTAALSSKGADCAQHVAVPTAMRHSLWERFGRLIAAAAAALPSAATTAAKDADESSESDDGAAAGAAAASRTHVCSALRAAWAAALAEARRGAAPALAGTSAGFTAELLASALPELLCEGGGLTPESCAAVAALVSQGQAVPAGALLGSAPAAAALLLACGKSSPAFTALAQALAVRWTSASATLAQTPAAAALSPGALAQAQASAVATLALCSATLSACPSQAHRAVASALESALGNAPGAGGDAVGTALAAVRGQLADPDVTLPE